jgi:hypothetical protein
MAPFPICILWSRLPTKMAAKLKIEKKVVTFWPSWIEGVAIGHIFERDPHRDHYCQVWFNLVQRFQRRRFKCDLLSIYA